MSASTATRHHLQSDAPEGIYGVVSACKDDAPILQFDDLYDVTSDQWLYRYSQLMARVLAVGDEVPSGIASVFHRPDGRLVVYGWRPLL